MQPSADADYVKMLMLLVVVLLVEEEKETLTKPFNFQ